MKRRGSESRVGDQFQADDWLKLPRGGKEELKPVFQETSSFVLKQKLKIWDQASISGSPNGTYSKEPDVGD